MSEEYIRIPINKTQELEVRKEQLQKLLATAKGMRQTIVDEDRDERTLEEVADHDNWISQIEQQIKDIDKLL